MKKNRLNGTIPTLRGKEHSQWQGGISSLGNFCRAYTRLYKEWIYPYLSSSNFTCQYCKSKRKAGNLINLHVHHDQETFSSILRKIAEQNSWDKFYYRHLKENVIETLQLKMKIADEVADYHINNNVSGIVLCEDCHKQLHQSLNFK